MGFQDWDKKKLLQKGDKIVFRVPITGHPVTINEIHAAQMGLVGLFIGMAYAIGMETMALTVAVFLTTYAIVGKPSFRSLSMKEPGYKTIGMKTIRHEPWWFIMPFITTFLVGVVFF